MRNDRLLFLLSSPFIFLNLSCLGKGEKNVLQDLGWQPQPLTANLLSHKVRSIHWTLDYLDKPCCENLAEILCHKALRKINRIGLSRNIGAEKLNTHIMKYRVPHPLRSYTLSTTPSPPPRGLISTQLYKRWLHPPYRLYTTFTKSKWRAFSSINVSANTG